MTRRVISHDSRSSEADQLLVVTFVTLAGLTVVLQIASLGALRSTLWGFHFYSFFHPAVGVACWVLFAAAATAILRRSQGEGITAQSRFADRHGVLVAVGFALACGLVMWLLRSEQLLLGDALPLKIDIASGKDFHPRQPLTMWLQQALYRHVGGLFRGEGVGDEDVARRVIALGSVVAGFFFAWAAVALGRLFTRGTPHDFRIRWLVTLVVLSQGFVELFFGYVENYTFYCLAIGVYVWLALRFMNGLSPLVLPGLALVTALLLHLSSPVLFPSFVVLVIWALRRRPQRIRAIRDLAVLAVLVAGVSWMMNRTRDYNLFASLFDVSGQALGGTSAIPSYMFSAMHVRDFLNEQALIGPIGLFAFIPVGLIVTWRRQVDAPVMFFLAMGIAYAAASWMGGDSNLGYARNWDLFAPAGVCYTSAVLFFVVKLISRSEKAWRVLAFGLVFSILHTAPWIWINHNEDLSLERMKTLPLGLGRTELVVGNWHLERGEREAAWTWFKRALEANPNNAPAHAFVAMLLTQENRFEEARVHYEKAVALRPDKMDYRNNYILTLMELRRYEEALPHLAWFRTHSADDIYFWRLSRDVLTELGREDELAPICERLLQFAEVTLSREPFDENANVEAGICLVILGREQEAMGKFDRALQTNPNSLEALFNMGSLLMQADRARDARPYLQKFVDLYPNHPNAPWAREQLGP